MLAGSAAQALLAWEEPDRLHRGLHGATFTATMLSQVRRRGWAQSVGEREPGVASVSAPVRGPSSPCPDRSSGWVASRAATSRPP
jgi:DNA-binding IclR family transcriptional regulator